MLMKNFNDTIGNRPLDFPACSAVPQSTAPPRAPMYYVLPKKIMIKIWKELLIWNLRYYFLKRVIINNLSILTHIRPMKCWIDELSTMHIYIYIYIYMCVCVCLCLYVVCVFMCIYVCVCVYFKHAACSGTALSSAFPLSTPHCPNEGILFQLPAVS